jgi:hypothetical protein
VGDFTSFISTESGFGTVEYKNNKAELKVVFGKINVKAVKFAE